MGEDKDIQSMSKDELEAYANDRFGIDIDKRKAVAKLRDMVEGMVRDSEPETEKVAAEVPAETAAPKRGRTKSAPQKPEQAGFLKNINTGLVFHWQPAISKQPYMRPCDKDGNLIEG